MSRIDRSDLDVFVSVARHCSFQRAAKERGVSVPSLSRTLRLLEQRLGIRLLNRTTRSVALTEAGQFLLQRLTPAIAEITAAIDELNAFRDTPAGLVRIAASSSTVQLLLSFLAESFLQSHPDVQVEIAADDSALDLVSAGFDIGLREIASVPRGMLAVPFGRPSPFVVVASARYVDTHGAPGIPAHLLEYSTIRRRLPNGDVPDWEFNKDGHKVLIRPAGPLTLGDAYAELQAAIESLGYARVIRGRAREALASRQLVQVLEDWSSNTESLALYYSSDRYVPAPARAFLEFARSEYAIGLSRPTATR